MAVTVKKRDSHKTKAKILAAAEDEFSKKGFYGTRVDEIAEHAGVNKRMLYEYYGKKEDLYKAVFLEVYSRLQKEEISLLDGETSCIEAVKKMIAFYFHYLSENQSYINLLLQENLNKGEFIQDVDFSGARYFGLKRLTELIERGKKQRLFRMDIDTPQVVVSLLMFPFSYFSNRYTFSHLIQIDFFDTTVLQDQIDYLSEMFLRYLCEPKALQEYYSNKDDVQ